MTKQEIFDQFEALGSESVRKRNRKNGATDNQFGVKMGDIRKIAKKIKIDHALAMELWDTENLEGRMLAILILDSKQLSADKLDEMVQSLHYFHVSDWLNAYIIKKHPDREKLRNQWLKSDIPMAARAGWNLTSIRIKEDAEGLNLPKILQHLENHMLDAHPDAQWTMNFALVEVGINHPEHREEALRIGEKLGVYSDYRAPKGCTSPFAPIWINEMVSRQKA